MLSFIGGIVMLILAIRGAFAFAKDLRKWRRK